MIPPTQDLPGEWTPQKWDYWLHIAHQQSLLDKDEEAVARKGVMVGDINGKSQFVTDTHSPSLNSIFANLVTKLTDYFSRIDISLILYNRTIHGDSLHATPERLQQSRQNAAIDFATHQLSQLPVMQALFKQNAKLTQVSLLSQSALIA